MAKRFRPDSDDVRTYIAWVFLVVDRHACTRERVVEYPSRDTAKVRKIAPRDVIGFYFFDRVHVWGTLDGKPVELRSEPLSKSPMYYLCGELIPVEELDSRVPEHRSMLQRMRSLGAQSLIHIDDRRESGVILTAPMLPGDELLSRQAA